MIIVYCRKIIKELSVHKVIGITATTGMASLQLGSQSTALHHWAGIMDGRFTHNKLEEFLNNDDKFAEAKKRIQQTQSLIVDEISMLSAKVFNMVEFVCRHVKKTDTVFGGIQVRIINKGNYLIERNQNI